MRKITNNNGYIGKFPGISIISKGGVKKKCLTRCWKVPPSQFQAKIYLPTSKTGSYWLYLDSNKASSIHFQIFFHQTAPTDYIWIQIKPVQYIFKYFPKKIWAKKFPIQELGPKSTYLVTSIVSEIFFLPPLALERQIFFWKDGLRRIFTSGTTNDLGRNRDFH